MIFAYSELTALLLIYYYAKDIFTSTFITIISYSIHFAGGTASYRVRPA